MIRYCLQSIWHHDSVLTWFGSPDSVLFDSDLLIQYCLIWISWFGTNLIRNGWFGTCICNHYLLTLRCNWWRHRCVQSTNLLTPIEILIHWAQWSCSCYTSVVFSPDRSPLECRDAWHVLRALLLGGSKMQGCQPIYANDYFTTRTVSQVAKLAFSNIWPWSNHLDIWTWPKYGQDVLLYQKWSFYGNYFKEYSQNRHGQTDAQHFPTYDLDQITLIFELDLNMVKMYCHTKNEVSIVTRSKIIARTDTDRHTYSDTHTLEKHYLSTY